MVKWLMLHESSFWGRKTPNLLITTLIKKNERLSPCLAKGWLVLYDLEWEKTGGDGGRAALARV
jgi:hypothetical protein